MKNRFIKIVLSVLLPFSVLIFWEYAVRFGLWPSSLIAAPTDVLVSFVKLLTSGDLFIHIAASFSRLLIGFFLGFLAAILLGIWVGVSKNAELAIAPTLSILAPIPPIAWIPLLIIIFGIGDGSKISLISVGAFFVLYTSAVSGIRGADKKLIELAHMYKKGRKELIMKILIPSSLAEVLTSVRIALALSWILLIAAEVIASSKGLGWLIWDSRNFSRPDDMISGMITVGLLGKLTDMFVIKLQKRLLSWREGFSGL